MAATQLMVLGQDSALVKFYIEGDHAPTGVSLAPRYIDYTVADNFTEAHQCEGVIWANAIAC